MRLWNNTIGFNANTVPAALIVPPASSWLLSVDTFGGQWLDFESNLFFILGVPQTLSNNAFVGSTATPSFAGATVTTFKANLYASNQGLTGPTWDTLDPALATSAVFTSSAAVFADDYRPQAPGPAIDTGAALGVTSDFRGVPRPQGAGNDIGAYEYCPGLDP
jgi:hypothetical protein